MSVGGGGVCECGRGVCVVGGCVSVGEEGGVCDVHVCMNGWKTSTKYATYVLSA